MTSTLVFMCLALSEKARLEHVAVFSNRPLTAAEQALAEVSDPEELAKKCDGLKALIFREGDQAVVATASLALLDQRQQVIDAYRDMSNLAKTQQPPFDVGGLSPACKQAVNDAMAVLSGGKKAWTAGSGTKVGFEPALKFTFKHGERQVNVTTFPNNLMSASPDMAPKLEGFPAVVGEVAPPDGRAAAQLCWPSQPVDVSTIYSGFSAKDLRAGADTGKVQTELCGVFWRKYSEFEGSWIQKVGAARRNAFESLCAGLKSKTDWATPRVNTDYKDLPQEIKDQVERQILNRPAMFGFGSPDEARSFLELSKVTLSRGTVQLMYSTGSGSGVTGFELP